MKLKIGLLVVGFIVLSFLPYFWWWIHHFLPAKDMGPQVSYADYVSILLTIVTIVLATLAFVVGLGAFWSFKEIQESARNSAADTIKNDESIKNLITSIVDEAVERKTRDWEELHQPMPETQGQTKPYDGNEEGK